MPLMLDLSGLNDYATIIQTVMVVVCIGLAVVTCSAVGVMAWLRLESAQGG